MQDHVPEWMPCFQIQQDRVQAKQEQQKNIHDTTAHIRSFSVGQSVLVQNFAVGERWIPGHIIEPVGPVSFMIELEDGRIFK